MNKTEANYAARLDILKAAGEIKAWRFERMTFKLANDTRYTPDFYVLTSGDLIEFHEVKGFMQDDAWVKLKVVADQYPEFVFRLARWKDKQWQISEVEAA